MKEYLHLTVLERKTIRKAQPCRRPAPAASWRRPGGGALLSGASRGGAQNCCTEPHGWLKASCEIRELTFWHFFFKFYRFKDAFWIALNEQRFISWTVLMLRNYFLGTKNRLSVWWLPPSFCALLDDSSEVEEGVVKLNICYLLTAVKSASTRRRESPQLHRLYVVLIPL